MTMRNTMLTIMRKWYAYGIIAMIVPVIFLILTFMTKCSNFLESSCGKYFLLAGLFTWTLDTSNYLPQTTGILWIIRYVLLGFIQYFLVGSLIGIIITKLIFNKR